MKPADGPTGNLEDRSVCLQVADRLVASYGWSLLDAHELAERVLESVKPGNSPRKVRQLCLHHYALVTHQACLQDSDPERRERAYTELYRFLLRTAYKKGWTNCAERLAQDALVLVYEQIDSCRKPGAFLIFAQYKLRQAFTKVQRENPEIVVDFPDKRPPEQTSDEEDPHAEVERCELAWALQRAIERLPNNKMQQVLILKYYAGLSGKEIAEQIGIKPANVRQLARRGITKLRQDPLLQGYLSRTSDCEENV